MKKLLNLYMFFVFMEVYREQFNLNLVEKISGLARGGHGHKI